MEKYLYLTKIEWVNAWVNGGNIPIKLASSYLNDKRDGIYTPDENLIYKSEVNFDIYEQSRLIKIEGDIQNLTIEDCNINGIKLPNVYNADRYIDDGIILSFSNKKSYKLCKRFKKEACVKIRDIQKLKEHIDTQLGVEGKMGICRYTQDHQRNHFLKSTEDAWQDEFRIFWPILEEKSVCIKKGTGKPTDLKCW